MSEAESVPVQLGPDTVVVVTMDQRDSRTRGDRVDATLAALNERFAASLRLPFERTAGDEIQAVAGEAGWLVELVLEETRAAGWWIGIGLGGYDAPLGDSARASRGEAFYAARAAVDVAKSRAWGFAVGDAREDDPMHRVEQCLIAASWIVRKRTDRQHEAVDLLRREGQANRVARVLGISEAAVSERLRGSGVGEENAARALAVSLLADASAA